MSQSFPPNMEASEKSTVVAPFKVQIAYATGSISFTVLERLLTMWLAFYYLDEKSPGHIPLSASAFFGILWFGRVLDAICDPLLASLSDQNKCRLGRRRIFLIIGGLPMVVFCALLFYPPQNFGLYGITIYLALLLCFFWAAFTTYAVAYLALMSELAITHRTRVNLATLKATSSMLGLAVVFILSPLLIKPVGFFGMVVIMACIAVVAAYVPVFGVNEPLYAISQPATVPIFSSIRMVFSDKPFVRYMISYLLFWLGFNVVTTGIPFYVKNLLQQPESSATFLMIATFGVAFLAFWGINRLSLHLGLWRAYLACMVMFVITLPMIFFMDVPSENNKLVIAMIIMGLIGAPVAGLLLIPDAIVSRFSRVAADQHSQGREAMYFGAQGFCLKLTFAVSGSLMGLLFDLFGKGGSSGTLGLKLTGPVSALFVALGLIVFWKYPGGAQNILDEG